MTDSFPDPPPNVWKLIDNASSVDAHFDGNVTDQEIAWMLRYRPLHPPPDLIQLSLDYSERQAKLMLHCFDRAGATHLLGVLNWAGVGSRWQVFLQFISVNTKTLWSLNVYDAFVGFIRHLGRVTSYRALALSSSDLQDIFEGDLIFPSGQLSTTAHNLAKIVSTAGACKVAVARLYIANLKRLIALDPSVSLHDEWATASLIAAGYEEQKRKVYLFEVSVPKAATLGWRLVDVASFAPHFLGAHFSNLEPWFQFESPATPKGVWFDATVARTERYVLYGVPFLRQRLRRLWVFRSLSELHGAVSPFLIRQELLRSIFPMGEDMRPAIGLELSANGCTALF